MAARRTGLSRFEGKLAGMPVALDRAQWHALGARERQQAIVCYFASEGWDDALRALAGTLAGPGAEPPGGPATR